MIVITGDSHVSAIHRGGGTHAGVTYWPLGAGRFATSLFHTHDAERASVTTTARRWRNRSFSRQTLEFDGAPALVALSLPLNTSRILRDYSWDTHVPWQLKVQAHETALSLAVVHALLAQDYAHSLKFVAALQACDINVVVIEGPHMFGDAPCLKSCRRDVCSYVESLYRKTVASKLDQMGVGIIAQRPETLTVHGHTKDDFNHEDPADAHHANAKFGALVFEDILAYAAKHGS